MKKFYHSYPCITNGLFEIIALMEPDFSQPEQPKPTLSSHVIDFIQTLVVFAAITTVIYLFIAQPHKVSGYSMFPNYHDGDYIITDKISYKLGQPKRGEIVVFKNPRDDSQDFIKRIIGLPGEKVKLLSNHIYINSQPLNEPYLGQEIITEGQLFLKDGDEVTVEPNHYFVLGDNRPRSSDSREWGAIETKAIIGKVFLRYWPKESIGLYPAYYTFK